MKRLGLLTGLLLFSATLTAESEPVNVVEIASFYCSNCYEMKQQIMPVIRAAEATGGRYHYVPIAMDVAQQWPAIAYLGVPSEQTSDVADALYRSVQDLGMRLDSLTLACSAIENYVREYDAETCLENAKLDQTMHRQKNVYRLMDEVMENYRANFVLPLFVIQQGNEVKKVMSFADYPNAAHLVNAVIEEVKYYAK